MESGSTPTRYAVALRPRVSNTTTEPRAPSVSDFTAAATTPELWAATLWMPPPKGDMSTERTSSGASGSEMSMMSTASVAPLVTNIRCDPAW